MTARLYLDEDVVPELARLLRARGYDAVTAHEADALGLPDEERLARAATERQCILTYNHRHFQSLAQQWLQVGRRHAVIIISHHQYSRDEVDQARRAVMALLDMVSAEDLENSVQILDPFRPR